MDTSENREATKTARSLREQLNELAETQSWVHHVADLNGGRSRTFSLDRPVTPISRAERLSQLGHLVDPSIFGGPSYRLSPKRPYQASPEAWLSADHSDYYWAEYDAIVWQPPKDPGAQSLPRGMHFYFEVAPDVLSLVSVSLSGKAWAGTTGHVRLSSLVASVQIPIVETFALHTIDLTFTRLQPHLLQAHFDLWLLAGIEKLIFQSVSFGAAPPVFTSNTI